MFTRCCFLALIAGVAHCGDYGWISGRVLDTSGGAHYGAPLPETRVRLTPDNGGPTLQRTRADAKGQFLLDDVKPGTYAVRFWSPVFHMKAVNGVIVTPGDPVDLGTIRLDLEYCDPSFLRPDGRVSLERDCSLDLGRGTPACTRDSAADFKVVQRDGGLFIQPLNGALLSLPETVQESCQGGCKNADYSNAPLRIDGFGPNEGFCVRTAKRRVFRVLTAEGVEPDTARLGLWYFAAP